MYKPWFDPATGVLLLDQYVAERPSFAAVMADGQVTDEEVAEQAERVVGLLRQLEDLLPEPTRPVATDALCELAVLYALERQRAVLHR